MRFLGYTLGDESVPMPPPRPELMEEMGALLEEATKSGVLVATGGIIGGWALMECRDLEEAVEWSKRFVSVMGEGEVRVRPAESVWVEGVYGPE